MTLHSDILQVSSLLPEAIFSKPTLSNFDSSNSKRIISLFENMLVTYTAYAVFTDIRFLMFDFKRCFMLLNHLSLPSLMLWSQLINCNSCDSYSNHKSLDN
jgi:hypothetical protein